MYICFVDDRAANREAWLQAMKQVVGSGHELEVFESYSSYVEAIERGLVPDVVFVDFFIGEAYGSEVIAMSREKLGSSVCLIAHSSMEQANQGMVRVGADFYVPRVKGRSPSPTILAAFIDEAAFLDAVASREYRSEDGDSGDLSGGLSS